jgi:hypothetical protein
MAPPILSPHEIAQTLHDAGHISLWEANKLEERIIEWAVSQKVEGRREGIAEAARRAKIAVAGIKSAAQRAAAEKPLRAVQSLLPQGSEDYQRGYRDGSHDERRKVLAAKPT